MRKSEREVIGEQEKFEALLRCPFLTLGMRGEVPYLVPLNFGAELCEGQLVLYFHCAKEGKKLDFLRLDPNVSFSAANMLRVFNKGVAPCGFTTDYESVYGIGKAEILKDKAARLHGLKVLMAHYTDKIFADDSFLPRPLALAEVVKISVREWTCKRLVRD